MLDGLYDKDENTRFENGMLTESKVEFEAAAKVYSLGFKLRELSAVYEVVGEKSYNVENSENVYKFVQSA